MIDIGDSVYLKKLKKNGKVINKYNNGLYIVEIESFKFQVEEHELEKSNLKINKNTTSKKFNESKLFKTTDPFKCSVEPIEIDLHGFTLKEAKAAVEDIISKAIFQKVTAVHIIHGKGAGILRTGIHDLLKIYKSKNLIRLYHYAEYHEGSYGKTIVYL